MSELKYKNSELPGEAYWRNHRNDIEAEIRAYYRLYQDWRMNTRLPMSDIDDNTSNETESFNNMINQEYDITKDYALLEMKHWRTPDYVIENIVDCFHPTKRLANKAELPFFVVKYFPKQECECWQFTVYPANELAIKILPKAMHMSEQLYTYFLYKKLRGLSVPKDLLAALSTKTTKDHKLNQ